MKQDIFAHIENIAKQTPDNIAISYNGKNLSYKDLLHHVNQVAFSIHAGASKKMHIGIKRIG